MRATKNIKLFLTVQRVIELGRIYFNTSLDRPW